MATDLLNQVMQGYYGTIRTGQPYYYDVFSYLRRAIGTALGKVEAGQRQLSDFMFDKNLTDLATYMAITVGSRPRTKIEYNNLVSRYNKLTGENIPTVERTITDGTAVITTSEGKTFESPRTSGEIAVDIAKDITPGSAISPTSPSGFSQAPSEDMTLLSPQAPSWVLPLGVLALAYLATRKRR